MISIIVPVNNAEDTLIGCLNSIRIQTYGLWEAILVDYGSTDESGLICDRFAERDARFKTIHMENQNISAAKNAALVAAQGDFVMFVSPVDWINAEMLQKMREVITELKGDMVTCRYFEDTIEELFLVPGPVNVGYMSANDSIQLLLAQTRTQGFLCNKLFRMSLIKKNPEIWFDENITHWEDMLFCIQCMLKSEDIIYSPPPYYHYFIDAQRSVNPHAKTGKITGLQAAEKAISLMKQHSEIDLSTIEELYMRLNLQLLFQSCEEEKEDSPRMKEFQKNLYRFDVEDYQDKELRYICLTARKSISLSKFYWKTIYKKQIKE